MGINIKRVTKIHNRFLRNRFEERLEQLTDISDNNYKRSLEYLFYGADPAMPNEIIRVMEEGFGTFDFYKKSPHPNCIPLVNGLASAEMARINKFFAEGDGLSDSRLDDGQQKSIKEHLENLIAKGNIKIPPGRLLVCKVYLSKCAADVNYPHFNPAHAPSEIWKYAPVDPQLHAHVTSIFRTKENDPKQRIWFISDNALVLPEYLVEYDYISNKSEVQETKRLSNTDRLNTECNKMLKSINSTKKILDNTYFTLGHKKPTK